MRRNTRDDHEGPQADARHRGGPRRGRAGSGCRRLSDAARIFDGAAATYDRVAFPFFTPFGEELVRRARLRPDERVLDAGCGAGAALGPAAATARDVVGVDISPAMAERAREAVPAAEVVVGDVAALPFEDGSFDVVLSAFVVFFLEDPGAGLREWARVLKPGGRLALATWAGPDETWSWEREVRREFASELPPELLPKIAASLERLGRFDEPAKVEAELRAAAFEPLRIEEHAIEFRFADEQQWWEWSWSHAGRGTLEALSEDARTRYRRRAFEAMQPLRDEQGGFPRRYTAIFAIARRPTA